MDDRKHIFITLHDAPAPQPAELRGEIAPPLGLTLGWIPATPDFEPSDDVWAPQVMGAKNGWLHAAPGREQPEPLDRPHPSRRPVPYRVTRFHIGQRQECPACAPKGHPMTDAQNTQNSADGANKRVVWPMLSDHFIKWMRDAGVIPERTRRLVIDATSGDTVRIFIEQFGGSEWIPDVVPPELLNAKVVASDPEAPYDRRVSRQYYSPRDQNDPAWEIIGIVNGPPSGQAHGGLEVTLTLRGVVSNYYYGLSLDEAHRDLKKVRIAGLACQDIDAYGIDKAREHVNEQDARLARNDGAANPWEA